MDANFRYEASDHPDFEPPARCHGCGAEDAELEEGFCPTCLPHTGECATCRRREFYAWCEDDCDGNHAGMEVACHRRKAS